MAEFHVNWEIELDAESFEDAARKASNWLRDPGSIARVFKVTNSKGMSMLVDLDEIEEEDKNDMRKM